MLISPAAVFALEEAAGLLGFLGGQELQLGHPGGIGSARRQQAKPAHRRREEAGGDGEGRRRAEHPP